MKELIAKICHEASVSPDQAKIVLLILRQHVKDKYPLISPMLGKAFEGLDEKIDELKGNDGKAKETEDDFLA